VAGHSARPQREPRNARIDRRVWRVGIVCASALLLAFAAAIVVRATDTTGASSRGMQEASCEALLRFRGALYTGEGLAPNVSQKHGPVLGEGTLPSCDDTPLEPPGTADAQDGEHVAIVALEGIAPSVALSRADEEHTIFVAAGRCAGYDSWATRLRCLRKPLSLDGRAYTATSLRATHVEVGAAIGSARLGESDVVVRRITSISPRSAVVTERDGSVIYLSNDRCFFSPGKRSFEQDLIACLTTDHD